MSYKYHEYVQCEYVQCEHRMIHMPKIYCITCKVPISQSSKLKHVKTVGHIRRMNMKDADDTMIMIHKDILALENTLQRLTLMNRIGREKMTKELVDCKCIDTIEDSETLFK